MLTFKFNYFFLAILPFMFQHEAQAATFRVAEYLNLLLRVSAPEIKAIDVTKIGGSVELQNGSAVFNYGTTKVDEFSTFSVIDKSGDILLINNDPVIYSAKLGFFILQTEMNLEIFSESGKETATATVQVHNIIFETTWNWTVVRGACGDEFQSVLTSLTYTGSGNPVVYMNSNQAIQDKMRPLLKSEFLLNVYDLILYPTYDVIKKYSSILSYPYFVNN